MARDIETERRSLASLKNWGDRVEDGRARGMTRNAVVDCGWGRLIFGQTFATADEVARVLADEAEGRRDVAFYVRDPQVVLAGAPQALFLDPSHTYRLDLRGFEPSTAPAPGLAIRAARPGDEAAINRLYLARSMIPVPDDYCDDLADEARLSLLVAEEQGGDGGIVGVVMGVDHHVAINDPDDGASLWALAVDPQARRPRVGEALVLALAARFHAAGRHFMDLSVMHDNEQAIALYRKLGFEQVPVYCLKKKNPINEKLFLGPEPAGEELNVYAQIIVDEARRRGIGVDIEDGEAGLFRLTLGGRSVACREALSELTTAVAMSRCDDKALTRRLLQSAGLRVPAQITVTDDAQAHAFLERHGRVVVKPARGEQGRAVAVDLRSADEVDAALARARSVCDQVIMESFVEGEDLRIIVIDGEVVAAAIRRPPSVSGDANHTVVELIEKQSRRRAAATGGESRIPLDEETERCVRAAGRNLTDVLAEGETLTVRKTANLHTGGTIHDVTDALHPTLAEAAVQGAEVLGIPVVGFDFMVPAPDRPDYAVIEANERPGLANHEPQPTAERFVDFLFPHSRADASSRAGGERRRAERRRGAA